MSHYDTLKDVAMRREIELLWVAAEGEKQRSAALEAALSDAQHSLKQLDRACQALTSERDNLADALHSARDELERRTAHFRGIVDDVHRGAATEQQHREASYQQRNDALALREAAVERREGLLQRVVLELQTWRTTVEDGCVECCGAVSHEATAWLKAASAQSSECAAILRAAHDTSAHALLVHVEAWAADVVGAMRDAVRAHQAAVVDVVAAPPPVDLLPSLAAGVVELVLSHAQAARRHNERLADAFADASLLLTKRAVAEALRHMAPHGDLVVEPHQRLPMVSPSPQMPLLVAAGPALSDIEAERDRLLATVAELQDSVAGAERRLLSRDALLSTLKRRAENAEDQLSLLQERQTSVQRALRDRDAQLEAARLRFEEQQGMMQSLKVLTAEQTTLRASGDAEGRMEDVGRRQATSFLKDQLSQQLELLHKIEVSEQHAANARAAAVVASLMEDLYAAELEDALADHADWLLWVSGRMDEARMTLHSTLIEAEEQVATMERQQQRLEELLSGTYSASSGLQDLHQPFHLASLQHVVDVALGGHPHHVGGIYTPSGGGPTAALLAPRWTPQQRQHAEHLAAAVCAMFLEIKLEFNNLQLHAHRSLLRLFWALAPKERASAHVRVHILEGALAVSESQRLQALTVAQWLEEQCLGAKDALAYMLQTTQTDCLPLDEQLVAWRPDAPQSGGGRSGLHTHRQPQHRSRSPLLPLGAEDAWHDDRALDALRESLQLGERKAADDARAAHDVCDRLVDTVVALQTRLLSAELHAQHATGHMSERNVEAEELRAHVDRIALTQAVEQEIADDTIGMLRNLLAMERQTALTSLTSLLDGCSERNLVLRSRDAAYAQQQTTLRAVLLLAQYLQCAFEASEEARSWLMCQCAQMTRVASLRTFKEAEYLLLTVHWELGAALEEAVIDARQSLWTSVGYLKQVHDTNHHLRCEVARSAEALTDLLEERATERAAQAMLLTFVQTSFGDILRNIHDALVGQVLEVRNVAWAYIERYVASAKEGVALRATINALEEELAATALQLDEHRVALASSSEAVVTVDAILTEKLRTLRERELDVRSLTARQEEHDGLLRSLREQLVVYHRLLQDASDEKATNEERARQFETKQAETADALRVTKQELADVMLQLDEERAAHRRTIRTITETVSEPRQRQQ